MTLRKGVSASGFHSESNPTKKYVVNNGFLADHSDCEQLQLPRLVEVDRNLDHVVFCVQVPEEPRRGDNSLQSMRGTHEYTIV